SVMPAVLQLALLSVVALCVALLLQRAGVNNSSRPAGHFPPMLHRKVAPEPARASGGHFSRAHNPEAIARAKGGTAAGGKSNLAGQIIPVYGFGILLYILYIIFKITSKGKTTQPHENRFPAVRSENLKRKISDFELNQLQERLKETEEVMERIVSRAQAQCGSPERAPVSAAQEEALLLQLREITRVMQEGQLMEGFSPEQKTTDLNYEHYVEGVLKQHVEDVSTEGCDEDEEVAGEMMKEVLVWNTSISGSRLIRRKTKTEAVEVTERPE
uniref:Resistance to inhibitors of cholinesterase protein 3 N-terminal domain-containing protein n=1 Tax=Astyanax mexicanus TaxID=7994 RepID=W5L7Y4_ASTMX